MTRRRQRPLPRGDPHCVLAVPLSMATVPVGIVTSARDGTERASGTGARRADAVMTTATAAVTAAAATHSAGDARSEGFSSLRCVQRAACCVCVCGLGRPCLSLEPHPPVHPPLNPASRTRCGQPAWTASAWRPAAAAAWLTRTRRRPGTRLCWARGAATTSSTTCGPTPRVAARRARTAGRGCFPSARLRRHQLPPLATTADGLLQELLRPPMAQRVP